MLHEDEAGFLADESFINYCFVRNDTDIFYWEQYVKNHPDELARVEEMKALILITAQNIHDIELKNQLLLLKGQLALLDHPATESAIPIRRNLFTQWKAAVAVACIILGGTLATGYFSGFFSKQMPQLTTYTTRMAEKKEVKLPDGSTVILNAGSHITVPADFDQKDRKVVLDGEAYFDVVHNAQKPFIVQTSRMDVKVLGTAFNVKAYPRDAVYETSLIRGSVELSLKKENKTVMLLPNQKYLLRENEDEKIAAGILPLQVKQPLVSGLLPVTLSRKDTTIIEVSWIENKLVFADETFAEVIKKLERWYGVTIELEDPSLEKNVYTASFRNEDIENVLTALQFSKPFTFKKENNKIIIYK